MSEATAGAGHYRMPDEEYDEHLRNYRQFLTLARNSVIVIVCILIFLAWTFL